MDQTLYNQAILDVQAGKKEAFGTIYDAFIKPIYNFVYYKTHHKETAEDITSLVFTKAFQNIHTYKPDKGPFSAWLYQIARNQVIDHYRSAHADVDIEDAWDIGDRTDIDQDIDTRDQLKKVQAYLGTLSAEQRDIVLLRVWQGLSYAEIAATMGKSEASCKMMFSRTISKLKENVPVMLVLGVLLHTWR